jgi:hypothetical protein
MNLLLVSVKEFVNFHELFFYFWLYLIFAKSYFLNKLRRKVLLLDVKLEGLHKRSVTLYSVIIWLMWDFLFAISFSIWFNGAREWVLCYPKIAQWEHTKVLSSIQTISKGFSWIEQRSKIAAMLLTSKWEQNSALLECSSMLILTKRLPDFLVSVRIEEEGRLMLWLICSAFSMTWDVFFLSLELIKELGLGVKGEFFGVFFILGKGWNEFVFLNVLE